MRFAPVIPFGFAAPARIEVGPGVARKALDAAPTLGARAFVTTGAASGRAAWLTEGLAARGLAVAVHSTPHEPTVDDARAAAEAARRFGADLVIAIGGGAALDLGKATAGLAGAGDPLDHLEVVGLGLPLTGPILPMIAIPTTAGTGSEATANAVLGSPAHGRKASLRDPRLLPRLALVDPDLLAGLPRPVALASGLDALVQVMEPFVSRFANPLTDALCADAIPRGLRALPRLLEGEPDARSDMAWVSLCGGLALANAKLGAVHGLAGVIGGRGGGAHGALCGRLAAPVFALTEAALPPGHPALDRYARLRGWIADALGGSSAAGWDRLAAFVDDQGLPPLSALGFSAAEADDVAAEALRASSTQGAPVPPTAAMLSAALAQA